MVILFKTQWTNWKNYWRQNDVPEIEGQPLREVQSASGESIFHKGTISIPRRHRRSPPGLCLSRIYLSRSDAALIR